MGGKKGGVSGVKVDLEGGGGGWGVGVRKSGSGKTDHTDYRCPDFFYLSRLITGNLGHNK